MVALNDLLKPRATREDARPFFMPKLRAWIRRVRKNERIWVRRRLVSHSPDSTQTLDRYSEESSPSPFVGILLCCQKFILTTMSAIPTGMKTPTLRLTAASMMKIAPLIEKSMAPDLYDLGL